jgi:hypothetical protein
MNLQDEVDPLAGRAQRVPTQGEELCRHRPRVEQAYAAFRDVARRGLERLAAGLTRRIERNHRDRRQERSSLPFSPLAIPNSGE